MTIERTINFQLPIPPAGKTPWQSYYSELAKVLDSVLGRFIAIGGFLGAWQNSTTYAVGNKLVDTNNGTTYQCVVAHTSAASPTTFSADRIARPTLWTSWSTTGISAGNWVTNRTYAVGEFVANGAKWAVCLVSHTSGDFNTDVNAGKWSVLVDLTAYTSVTFPITVAQGGTNATSASEARTNLGLVIGTNVQAFSGNLATLAAMPDVANLSTVQSYSSVANLTSLVGLTLAANKGLHATGAGALALYDLTAAGLALLDDANATAQRATLGLVIGTDVQAFNARLADIAGITWNQGDILYYNGTNLVDLAPGVSGQFLKTNGAAANPAWAAVSSLNFAILRDEKADATQGGTYTSGAWQQCDLNTEHSDPDAIVSIASNRFTPISGTYLINVVKSYTGTNQSRLRLYNNTAGSEVAIGQNNGDIGSGGRAQLSLPWTRFTANGTDAYQIDFRGVGTRATDGMGEHDGMTVGVEVYMVILLIKIA